VEDQTCRKPVTLDDLRSLARAAIDPVVWEYIDCGAGDGRTQRANEEHLDRIGIVPRCLRGASAPAHAMAALGHTFRYPVGISPTAFQRLVHDDGEIATAQAAAAAGVPMIVSAMSSVALEDIAQAAPEASLWLQTYLFKDRATTAELVARAERAGYAAVVVTLGCPVPGRRDRLIRGCFQLPDDVRAANFGRRDRVDFNNPIHSVDVELDAAATWRDLAWLRGVTRLPLVGKGVIDPRDVAPALEAGLSAIMVSNHGGRQLDGTIATIAALPAVVDAAAGRLPVFVDSGFRRGTDVLKALALGATGVFLGRPVLWALAAGGRDGVADALTMLGAELRVAMQLAGCASLSELGPGVLTA
jgi:isopentenyl diphosphate isomerase/L-lactate dehydrogenase-like FMN-dependent dehydrogenase